MQKKINIVTVVFMMLLVGLGTVQADSSPGLRAGPNVPERHKFFLTACSSVMKTLIQNNDPSFIYSAFVECSNDLGLLDAADVFFALVDEKNSENLPYHISMTRVRTIRCARLKNQWLCDARSEGGWLINECHNKVQVVAPVTQ